MNETSALSKATNEKVDKLDSSISSNKTIDTDKSSYYFNIRLGSRGEFDDLELNIVPRISQETCAPSPEHEIQLFLNFVRSNGLSILNGRLLDPYGACTHFGPSGDSVIDYVLAPLPSLDNITPFKVGPHLSALSDHCLLSASSPLFFH